MHKLLLPFLFLLITNLTKAQTNNVTFKTIAKNNEKVPNVNIEIKNLADSVTVSTKQTDSNGVAQFSLPQNQKFFYIISSVGYETVKKALSVATQDITLNINLKNKKNTSEIITVTAKKPLITQEDDKTIVDPENLAQSSTNAFEVLEKTPGVFSDQDGNFYLSSTTPATVQINGRDMRLSAADMASLIKALPPNAIQKIEILRTPSAKNDASGSGGLINIVLRKGVKLGMAGSVFVALNQGIYGNQTIGASLSNSNDKKSIYASMGFNNRNNFDELQSNRYFKLDSLLKQNSNNRTEGWNPYLNFGGSYIASKQWEIGYDANFSYNKSGNQSNNLNTIDKISTNSIVNRNNNDVNSDGRNVSLLQSINSKFKLDSTNKLEWTNSISYNIFDNNNEQVYNTDYTLPGIFNINGNGTQNSNRGLTIIQTDLVWKPVKKLTIETGAKTSWINYKNKANFFKNNTSDLSRSNEFKYTENITALYVQAAKKIEKFVIKSGIRLESTNMQGNQLVPTSQKFTIKRKDFFPYVYLSRPIVTIMKYDMNAYLVYRKSITRPGYDLLNPFSRFVDNYLSEVGNPNLKPQFTETYEANVSFEDVPVFAIGRNNTKGVFTNVIYQNPNNPSEALRTYDNLGSNTENYLKFTVALPPGGKYFFVVGGQRNFNTYDGLYENKPLKFSNTSWNFFTYHQLKLDKRSTLTMQGWMQTGGLYQFYELSNFGQLNASINRTFLNRKLIITLNVRDLLLTNKNEFTINQGTVNAFGNRISDTRRVGLNIRYNFGVKKKNENQDFTSEAANKN